jgi:hypothetical protein
MATSRQRGAHVRVPGYVLAQTSIVFAAPNLALAPCRVLTAITHVDVHTATGDAAIGVPYAVAPWAI